MVVAGAFVFHKHILFPFNSRLKQAKDLRETLVEKLKIVTESNLSAEERAARMDELLEDEEKRQKEIDQDLKYLRDLQFKKMQELHETKTSERNHEAEIQGSQAAIRNLASKISKLDTDSLKQQEIIYNQVSMKWFTLY